ncbi:MAG: low specificity L-threonine aldolase [Oligoflexia bacterium]|nr:low specificity L-threonine aldolase [Oligoflexia bacterium]
MKLYKTLASDNFASVHPKILEAIANVNKGHAKAYGYDDITLKARNLFNEIFESKVETFFVFNGTGANILALNACTQRFSSVICPITAHINVDECGAPEFQLGIKTIAIATKDGKLSVEQIENYLHVIGNEHHSQPKVISISQSSELGTVYSTQEIKELADFAHKHSLYLHVDGARIANAVVSAKTSLAKMLVETKVDVISFGGTKNGLMLGEAVVFINQDLAKNVLYLRKQSMQLCSKMRYISAQFIALFENDLWLSNAKHANSVATYLESELQKIDWVKVLYPTQSNAVFCQLPREIIPLLQEKSFFWIWNEEKSIARFMCSFDSSREEIDEFIILLKNV